MFQEEKKKEVKGGFVGCLESMVDAPQLHDEGEKGGRGGSAG